MATPHWVILVVAILTAGGVLATLWQKQRSEQIDRALKAKHEARVEWWRRFQWGPRKRRESSDGSHCHDRADSIATDHSE